MADQVPEMVDRVARAAFGSQYWDDDARETNAEMGRYGPTKTERIEAARKAIEAMREPTEAMVNAAWPYDKFNGPAMDHFKTDLLDYWRAMIDAALGK